MIKTNLKSINPKNNSLIKEWDIYPSSKIDTIIKKTANSQIIWNRLELSHKIDLIKKLSRVLF